MLDKNIVHVAIAVIKNQHEQYFIAKRPKDVPQGSLWEFPGGKVENNESVIEALSRELFEEVGITLTSATPLIKIHHNYGNKFVLLDVFIVDEFSGEAFGKEGQETCWINLNEFSLYAFPSANLPIIKALRLPDKYLITGKFNNTDELFDKINSAIKNGIKLIQFRAHDLVEEDYFTYAKKIFSICNEHDIKLLLNTSTEYYIKHEANYFSHGIHLSSKEIKLFSQGILDDGLIVAASIHNKEELSLAENNNLDFVVLSPVNKTLSHPESYPLGWDKFESLAEEANIPIYALGGMTENDLNISKTKGAQGIAAISAFWKD